MTDIIEMTPALAPLDAQAMIAQNVKRRKSGNEDVHRFAAAQEKQAQEQARMAPTVAELAGHDGQPIMREGLAFYTRSPKMRALDDMTEALQRMQAGEMRQGESVMQIATYFLVLEGEDGKRRPATYDEIADNFDLADVQLLGELAGKYLNLKVMTGAGEPKNG